MRDLKAYPSGTRAPTFARTPQPFLVRPAVNRGTGAAGGGALGETTFAKRQRWLEDLGILDVGSQLPKLFKPGTHIGTSGAAQKAGFDLRHSGTA
jgi:hypothetical protein